MKKTQRRKRYFFGLVVIYKNKFGVPDRRFDRSIAKRLGKRIDGSGFCFVDENRDIGFHYRSRTERDRAAGKLKTYLKRLKSVAARVSTYDYDY